MKSLTKIHEANKQVPTENTNYFQSKLQRNLLYWATSLISHPSSVLCFLFFSEIVSLVQVPKTITHISFYVTSTD